MMAALTASKDAADATVIKLERELEVFRTELDEAQSGSATSSVAVSELRGAVEAQRREYALSRAEAEARLREAQEEREALAGEIQGLKVGVGSGRVFITVRDQCGKLLTCPLMYVSPPCSQIQLDDAIKAVAEAMDSRVIISLIGPKPCRMHIFTF